MNEVFRRWESSSADLIGLELMSQPLSVDAVKAALIGLETEEIASAAYLLVPLANTNHCGVCAAIETVQSLDLGVRVCLVVDGATLERIDSRLLAWENVGLVLDEVDAETPLSAIVRDTIEAVRFRDLFVSCAFGSLRVDAALGAMLGLAHKLGLATLGPATPNDWSSGQRRRFDYVPAKLGTAAPALDRGACAPSLRNSATRLSGGARGSGRSASIRDIL